jgi:hypothetical protein
VQDPDEQLEQDEDPLLSPKSKLVLLPEVENEDIFFTTFFAEQCLQVTSSRLSFKEHSLSKVFPQSRHRNSYMGIFNLP